MVCVLESWKQKMSEILEKSGNLLRGKKWEPCSEASIQPK